MEIINALQFSDGEHVVPLWMLDYLYLFSKVENEDGSLDITHKEFEKTVTDKIESDTMKEIIVNAIGFYPIRRK